MPATDSEGRPPNADMVDLDLVFVPGVMADRAVRRALANWQQGDLIRNIRLFWATPGGVDPVTGVAVDDLDDGLVPVLAWDGTSPTDERPDPPPHQPSPVRGNRAGGAATWAIVTSQTCDVVATGPGARHPTVQVSPLRNLSQTYDKGQITQIRRGSNVDLVYVPNVPEDGAWVADLRISLPVSKGLLLQHQTIRGFDAGPAAYEFAERVAAKYRRPAMHDEISDGLVNGLRALVADSREADQAWAESIEQFRLLVTRGDRLNPTNIAVIAITHEQVTFLDRQPLRQWRGREKKRLARASDGIELAPIRFIRLEDMSVRDYRESVALRVPELGNPAYW